MSHNCAGWSVLGVVDEKEDLTMDYIKGKEVVQSARTGYNFRPSDRWRNWTI